MRFFAFVLAVLAVSACGDEDRNPILGGGTGGSGETGDLDAGPDAAPSTEFSITGTVCQVADLRQGAACTGNPQGLQVSIDGDSDVTDATGAFELVPATRTASIDVRVEGVGYRTSVVRLLLPSAGDATVELPAVTDTVITAVEVSLGEGGLGGTLVAHIARDQLALEGAVVADVPVATLGGTYYDTAVAPYIGVAASTGGSGTIVVFGLPLAQDNVTLSVRPTVGEDPVSLVAPAEDGTISFISAEFPGS